MDNVYNNINDYNPNRDRKNLDDMIADFMTNKKFRATKFQNYLLDARN